MEAAKPRAIKPSEIVDRLQPDIDNNPDASGTLRFNRKGIATGCIAVSTFVAAEALYDRLTGVPRDVTIEFAQPPQPSVMAPQPSPVVDV